MSTDLLREAAHLMRQRAVKATPGVWKLWGMSVMADQDGSGDVAKAVDVAGTVYWDENGKPRTWNAQHIASWHPLVALAVADWLDMVGRYEDAGSEAFDLSRAIKVARAYLGRDA